MHRCGMKQLADGCESNDFCKALHPSSDGHGPAGQKLLILVGIPQGLASWDGMGIALLSTSQDGRAPLSAVFQARPSISRPVLTESVQGSFCACKLPANLYSGKQSGPASGRRRDFSLPAVLSVTH